MPKRQKTYIIRIKFKTRRLSRAEIKEMVKGILLNSGILKEYTIFKILNGESRVKGGKNGTNTTRKRH